MTNIIGLSSNAGVGKDTVARFLVDRLGYVRVALADPMKRFAMDALGFDAVTLWGPSALRQGTIESRIDVSFFRGKAKRFARSLLPGGDWQDLYGKLTVWGHGLEEHGPEISARVVLQTLGTEVGRACDRDVWVRYLIDRIVPHVLSGEFAYSPALGLLPRAELSIHAVPPGHATGRPAGVVVSDVRFLNEVEAVLGAGGRAYRLRRPGAAPGDAGGVAGHASETEQTRIPDGAFTGVLDLPEGLDVLESYLVGQKHAGRF